MTMKNESKSVAATGPSGDAPPAPAAPRRLRVRTGLRAGASLATLGGALEGGKKPPDEAE